MHKQVLEYKDIKQTILEAVDIIADPVRQTMSPKGRNVIFEDKMGEYFSTNDGVTIAKNISVKDPVKNAIIEIIKDSSLKTNSVVGDGTSTSILLSQILIKEAFKLIDNGHNAVDVKTWLADFLDKALEELKCLRWDIRSDDDLFNIARISANNDEEIATHVVQAVKTAGTEGMIFIEPHKDPETKIIEDKGFVIEEGMFAPDFRTSTDQFATQYMDAPVLVTDKRIYYPEEAETILKTALKADYNKVVVVARDFIGQAPNVFITNHNKGVIKVLLVKDPEAGDGNNETLQDLATFLGGPLITEKEGSLVDNLTVDDFCVAERIYSTSQKTIIGRSDQEDQELEERIEALRKEVKQAEEEDEQDKLERRIAALTNGMVTIKIGGNTRIEMAERGFRYEDAVAATRESMKHGYLVGGGVALYCALSGLDVNPEIANAVKKVAEANITQIALNCGKHPPTVLEQVDAMIAEHGPTYGYNAVTDTIEDLFAVGVIDPYRVTEMSLRNSVSVANEVISSNFLIINDQEEEHQKE